MGLGRWVGILLMTVSGCRSDGSDEAYVPPTFPPPPPPETRIDEATGAILAKPEASWAWLEDEALRARGSLAVLGMRRDARCEGWVEVSPATERSPRGRALEALERRQAEAPWEVHVDEDVLYAAHTARRWEIQRPEGDFVVSERSSFLVEGPRLYALRAVARDPEYTRRRRCLDAVTAAFDVMPWEPPVAAPPDSQHPGDAGTGVDGAGSEGD